MNSVAILLLSFVLAANDNPRLEQTAPLSPPLNTVATSWVILDAEISAEGRVRSIDTLSGAEPFRHIALSNVGRWTFKPVGTLQHTNSRAAIVFIFRPPDLFAAPSIDITPTVKRQVDHPAYPVRMTDPGYPINSVGEGTVVVELQVAASGAVKEARVVTDSAGLAIHAEQAVRSWRFEPAVRDGVATVGTVIVVASFLRPALNNAPPTAVSSPVAGPPPAPSVFRDNHSTTPRF